MVAADQPRISTGRVQDWINTVLNPIIDALRRELRFLPNGPWKWVPTTRSFEYFLPAKEYLASQFLDNYDDFVDKHPEVARTLVRRDLVLKDFADEFARGFDLLATAPFPRTITVDQKSQLTPARDWIRSYVVGKFEQLPDYYVAHEAYNPIAHALLAEWDSILQSGGIDVSRFAISLRDSNESLLNSLIQLRRELADVYGARIKPYDSH